MFFVNQFFLIQILSENQCFVSHLVVKIISSELGTGHMTFKNICL